MRIKEKVNQKPLYDLRKRRKSLHLTQQQVADSAGISMYTYSQIERGYVNLESVKIGTLKSILNVLYGKGMADHGKETEGLQSVIIAGLHKRTDASHDSETSKSSK